MEPDKLVRLWFDELWCQGKEETLDKLFAKEGLAHGLGPDRVTMTGPDAYRPFFRSFRSAIPDMRVTVEQTVREGDLVAVQCHVTGTHTGDGLGIPPTGSRIDFTGMSFVRVRDDKIIEAWNNFDFMSFYQQVKILPALPL